MPRYSIIVPVYNVEEYLPACLDSVLRQKDVEDYELILIDDGSGDGSGQICDAYALKDERIRVHHIQNHGVSFARNTGLDLARGEYILFLDSDDLWEPELLLTLEQMAQSEPDVMIFGNSRMTPQGQIICDTVDLVIPVGESGAEVLQELFALGAVPKTYSCCYAMKRSLLQKNGICFREDLKVSEDFELIMRLLAVAEKVVGTDAMLYCYRIRQTSATAGITEKKLMDNLTTKAMYFQKYPVRALANIYATNALLVAELKKEDCVQARAFLKENRKIWDHVSQPPLKLGRILVKCFGDYGGTKIYRLIRSAAHLLRKKNESDLM